MNIKKAREDTPCENIYFNHASTSIPPIPVIEASQDYYRMAIRYGATSKKAEELTAIRYNAAKQKMAEFINADQEEIMFLPNGTVGIHIVAQGMQWKEGQNIILDSMSFISNTVPWIQAAKTYGLEIRWIPSKLPGILDIQNMENLIDKNTALICVTHAANSLGVLQDIEKIGEIASKYQIPYCVDAAGSLGAVSLDVEKIKCDFLTASGRKYLRGPSGTGVLYVKKEKIVQLNGWVAAWNSGVWDCNKNDFSFYDDIQRFNYGEKNYPGIFGIAKAVEYIDEIGGIFEIENRIIELMEYLFNKLKEIKEIEIIGPQDVFCRRGTMGLTMNKKTCGEIADYLNHNGVGMMGHHFFCPGVCRLFGIEGTARISLHYWNTEEEIDQLIILLSQIV